MLQYYLTFGHIMRSLAEEESTAAEADILEDRLLQEWEAQLFGDSESESVTTVRELQARLTENILRSSRILGLVQQAILPDDPVGDNSSITSGGRRSLRNSSQLKM